MEQQGWDRLKARVWPVASGVLLTALVVAIGWPFLNTPDPTPDDIATSWNKGIARLGLLPVFPPSEDLHVGDIWAVVVEDAADPSAPLLGKAVRVDRIEFRKQIVAEAKGRPVFDETPDPKKDAIGRPKRKEVAPDTDEAITLALAAFPGISISYAAQSTGAVSSGWGKLGGGRQNQQTEELRIPVAETYGVSTRAGYIGLDEWCKEPATKIRCTDRFVRNLMAFALGEQLLAKQADGQYRARLQLSLVTRVYLTREIQQRRQIQDGRGIVAQGPAAAGKAGDMAPPATGTPPPAGQTPQPSLASIERLVSTPAAGSNDQVSILTSSGVEVSLQQVFQRPVAFGFRTVNVKLEPKP